jgi:UDP-2-acetamido-3-amino-2,3-dideoxy-glucuronate N-acetyltransferase
MSDRPFFVHESSYVDEPCQIGAGTKIWHFSHVMQDAIIGKYCNIGQNVVVSPGVRIGDGCKIQNNVSLYMGVVLEDDVFCGPSMVFTNVVNPRSEIVRKHEYRTTLVRRGASIGANATIVCGVTVGLYSFIGAGAVVTRDVPDHALMMGVPARRTGWVCRCGVKLVSETLVCDSCSSRYAVARDGLEATGQAGS